MQTKNTPYDNKEFRWNMIPAKFAFIGGVVGGVLALGTLGFIILLTVVIGHSDLIDGDGSVSQADDTEVLGANDANVAATPDADSENTVGDVVPASDADYIRGVGDAKITLIEYSDFECPFCKRFHPTAKKLLEEYPDQVNWVFRHFPLSFHPTAQKAAEAAECAGKLGGTDAYWAFGDNVFETERRTEKELADVAGDIGLNVKDFQTCLDSGEFADKVQQNLIEGQNAGVKGTPGNILLNNETGEAVLVPGAVPYTQLKSAVDQLLNS